MHITAKARKELQNVGKMANVGKNWKILTIGAKLGKGWQMMGKVAKRC